ncbi:MAG: MotA/TolQ/ExbB proton channel family protein [Planctomycetota bacterium]
MRTQRRTLLAALVAAAGASLASIGHSLQSEDQAPSGAAAPEAAATEQDEPEFAEVSAKILADIKASEAELTALRARAREQKAPLATRLTELQRELVDVEAELQATTRRRNDAAIKLSNLSKKIADRKAEADFLTSAFTDYLRNFEARLHISEVQRYRDAIEAARNAPDNVNLSTAEIFTEQVRILDVALERLMELGGGAAFDGSAVDDTGLVREGSFVLVGPTAIFRSKDGTVVGTAETRVNAGEATIERFAVPEDEEAASLVVQSGSGAMPFDMSLGNAHKIAATKETLVEHIQNGGPIMYPILGMAAIALLVAIVRWIILSLVRRPGRKALGALFEAVAAGDEESAKRRVDEIKGPAGEMLAIGVAHIRRSRDLIEEVMYEKVLVTKAKVNKGLPFIAVCAASAPLLGLLGTVTGIINTFKQITVFGSGDVKQLSGGISEALITTKFGLIVAIPSLILHAYLLRKARVLTTEMETCAIRYANEVERSDEFGDRGVVLAGRMGSMGAPDQNMVRGQVAAVLTDMLGPLSNDEASGSVPAHEAAPKEDPKPSEAPTTSSTTGENGNVTA